MLRAGRCPTRPLGRGGLAAALAAALLAAWPGPVLGQPVEAQRAAAAVARIGELEEELRRLRGRIEALEAERDQLRGRLERLQRDLEARLAALEAGLPAGEVAVEPGPGTPSVCGGGAPAVVAAPTRRLARAPPQPPAPALRPSTPTAAPAPPARPPGRSPAAEEGDLAARRGYVLGTIPRAAILGTDPARTAPAQGAGAAAAAPAARSAPQPTATAPGQQAARAPSGGAAPGGPTAAGRLAAARELLQKGDWPAAEDALRRFLEDFPNDPQAATAAFWLGETYLVREDWQNAAATFARNYRTFGGEAPRAPDNLLKLGVALARLGDKEKACQTFAELDRRHPGASSAVRQALARERVAAGCS